MRTKYSILTVLAAILASGSFAQQLPQFSQYMQNMYVLNPAASCLESDIDINLGYRQQWAGFDGAPQTYYLSGSVNLGKQPEQSGASYSIPISHRSLLQTREEIRKAKHVVGGLVAVDEYGLFKRTSVMASYSYHHPISDKYWISVGTSMGWYGLNFGADNVILENPTDNTYGDFIANGNRSNLFDINAGLFIYSDRLFLGYSVYQIAQNEINLGNESSPVNLSQAKLNIHHFATLGYSIPVADKVDITPSVMVKLLGPAPVSYDLNLRAEFNRKFWLGVSYRNEDAISGLAGLRVNDWLRFGYAYDFITSDINNLSSGSHELVLGIQLDRKNER
ncbi:MAG: type IX secretion system membrane protein PorP/SprF [Cryomorphaceae bacterium]|nr:type IX secretion system membrane protein PorP/SprF [Flavobacteriales bacterium]